VFSRLAFVVAAIAGVVASTELVDPTLPPSRAEEGFVAPALHLQGIVRRRDHELAVIDGRHVVEGDRIGEWVVVEIRRDAVWLRDGARELELRLAPEIRRNQIPRGGKP
jgi:hypothetical protein